MSAGTKVTIAIVVLFAAVLGIYYGFGGPDATGSMPAEALPPAEDDIAGTGETAAPITQGETGSDLARSIERALWAQGSTDDQAAAGDLGGEAAGTGQADDPWVLRAPTLMPEPESRALPATTPAAAAPARTVEYVVQPDDSMWTISQRWFGDATRWREIARGNPHVNPDRLQVGQRLQLPARSDDGNVGMNRAAAIPAVNRPATAAGGPVRYYTVRSGDTLSTISDAHYRTERRWRDIYEANRGTIGGNPDRLQVGMKLRIP